MSEGPAGTEDTTRADPFAPPATEPAAPPPPVDPSADPSAAVGAPTRHWDGQQWLVWTGTAWVPEGAAVAAPSSGGSKRTLFVVVGIIVLALVVGGVFVGMRVVNANKTIVVPSSLGGLDKATDPDLTAAADKLRTSMASAIHGEKFDVAAYGSPSAGSVAFLVAARNGGSSDDFFAGVKSSGLDVSDQTTVGDAQCVTAPTEDVSVCMRSDSGLLVAVILSGTDTAAAASMVDDAWKLQ